MRICEYPYDVNAVRNMFAKKNLLYGDSSEYASLISPAFVLLSKKETIEFDADLEELAKLYRLASKLYIDSLLGGHDNWIIKSVESSLSKEQIMVTRACANNLLEPMMTRVDYVSIGSLGRKIAEVQWKSGGPGLFIGHEFMYRTLFETHPSCTYGNLVDRYFTAIKESFHCADLVVVNEGRKEWLQGEKFLIELAKGYGIEYYPADRAEIKDNLCIGADGLCRYGNKRINVLRGRGFSDLINSEILIGISKSVLENKLWVEIPLNYIYRQKWPMILPFHVDFKSLFSDRLREILIPTTLLDGETIDLSSVYDYFGKENIELMSINNIREVADLPLSLRRKFVIKHSSGVGKLQNGGKGVFRLLGSKRQSFDIIEQIIFDMRTNKSTWVTQPMISCKYDVPFYIGNERQNIAAHLRFMLFGGREKGFWEAHGALANFARDWKVSGSRQSSFSGVRVEKGATFLEKCQSTPFCP